MKLEEVSSPQDLKKLSYEELQDLANQIRHELIETVSVRGGHLASNLGVVELTLALHRVFDMPEDKILFDVGHQSYVHKLLTGRYWTFQTLRSFGGLAGFPKRSESPYDIYETGHASTAISAALGIARARDLRGENYAVISVVGDGALTGGLCFEALDDAGNSKTRMIVILNDNEMSISPNVGAVSKHLTDLRVSRGWTSTKRIVKTKLQKIPLIGMPLYRLIHRVKNMIKALLLDDNVFTTLGFQYLGPIDGHDIQGLEKTLRKARQYDGPAVIHVLTKKGYGYEIAEEEPERFHGIPPFYVETGRTRAVSDLPSYGQVMCEELNQMAEKDDSIVAITAAMAGGTGLDAFQKKFPDRFYDVGIAEEHAAVMCAGLAVGGMKPYYAVYASFFQRAYDQMIEDVCMQRLKVVFLLDRAGLVGEDGATHHGVYDLASMLPVPYLTVLAPMDLRELRLMMRWTAHAEGPVAIRYGRYSCDLGAAYESKTFTPGKWRVLAPGKDCVIFAVGSMVKSALETREILLAKGIEAAVVNCSTVKPMDMELLNLMSDRMIVTMEEHVLTGGFGSAVCAHMAAEQLPAPAICFGIPDMFVQHGGHEQLLKYLGLIPKQMSRRIEAEFRFRNKGAEHGG